MTKKWEFMAPLAIDYATKQVTVTLGSDTAFTVVYKNCLLYTSVDWMFQLCVLAAAYGEPAGDSGNGKKRYQLKTGDN